MRFFSALLSLFAVGTCLCAAAAERAPAPNRERCLEVLRQVLDREPRWIKVHAAEFLLGLDYPDRVNQVFQAELAQYGNEPQYRIGIWRVLAKANIEQRQSAQWVAKIRAVFLDPAASDRLHAVESLAKLGYRAQPGEELALVQKEAAAPSGSMAVYARWVLVHSGEPGAEQALADLLRSSDAKTRGAAAYVFLKLRAISAPARAALLAAIEAESADSPVRATLVAAAAVHTPSDQQTTWRQPLIQYARSGELAQRLRALDALGRIAQPDDLPLLQSLLAESDPDVRAAAAWVLLRIDRRDPHYLGLLDWTVIVAYAIGMLAIGWYYWRKNKTKEDYLLGGRKMKPLTVGLSLFATLFSTISYLGWPGEMIKYGPMIAAIVLAYPLVALVAGYFMIPYIMSLRITSAYEILEVRLGLAVRMLGSALFLMVRLLWMAVIIYATVGSVLLPLIGLDHSWTPHVCCLLGIVTLVYTAMGGLKAVVITDVLQALILFAGAVVSIIAVSVYLGGVGAWWPHEWAAHWTEPTFYDPNVRITFLGAIVATFTWYISTAGSDQMAIQRYLATRDAPAARGVLNMALIANTLVLFLLAALGLALLAYFRHAPQQMADGQTIFDNADQLFTRFIVVGLPPGFSGLVVAGLLAAAMSSLSAGINSSCAVVTADFIDRFGFRKSAADDPTGARMEKYLSVVIGAIVVFLSSYVGEVQGNLLEIAYKVVNALATPLFGLFFMAMFVPWATGPGTLIGAAFGVTVVVGISYWEELTGTKGISFLWAMPACFLVQIAVSAVASLLPWGRRAGSLRF